VGKRWRPGTLVGNEDGMKQRYGRKGDGIFTPPVEDSHSGGRHPDLPSLPTEKLPLSKRRWLDGSGGIPRNGVRCLEEGDDREPNGSSSGWFTHVAKSLPPLFRFQCAIALHFRVHFFFSHPKGRNKMA